MERDGGCRKGEANIQGWIVGVNSAMVEDVIDAMQRFTDEDWRFVECLSQTKDVFTCWVECDSVVRCFNFDTEWIVTQVSVPGTSSGVFDKELTDNINGDDV